MVRSIEEIKAENDEFKAKCEARLDKIQKLAETKKPEIKKCIVDYIKYCGKNGTSQRWAQEKIGISDRWVRPPKNIEEEAEESAADDIFEYLKNPSNSEGIVYDDHDWNGQTPTFRYSPNKNSSSVTTQQPQQTNTSSFPWMWLIISIIILILFFAFR